MSKTYDLEFKENAVKVSDRTKMTIVKVAADLEIGLSTLKSWIALYRTGKLRGSLDLSKKQQELQQLRKENCILKEERDILKKAIAIFSQQKRKDLLHERIL